MHEDVVVRWCSARVVLSSGHGVVSDAARGGGFGVCVRDGDRCSLCCTYAGNDEEPGVSHHGDNVFGVFGEHVRPDDSLFNEFGAQGNHLDPNDRVDVWWCRGGPFAWS